MARQDMASPYMRVAGRTCVNDLNERSAIIRDNRANDLSQALAQRPLQKALLR